MPFSPPPPRTPTLEGWDCRHVRPYLASHDVLEGRGRLTSLHDMVSSGLAVMSTSAKDEKLSFLPSGYRKCGLDFLGWSPSHAVLLSLPARWPS